jgi:hypothetical protein
MVLNATFNNISVISCRSFLLVEEIGVPRENHWPTTSHWQTLSHNVVSSTPRHNTIDWLFSGKYFMHIHYFLIADFILILGLFYRTFIYR